MNISRTLIMLILVFQFHIIYGGSIYSYKLMVKTAKKDSTIKSNFIIEGNCDSGRIEGPFTIKTKKGNAFIRGTIVSGQLDGIVFVYASTGDKVISMYFKNGFLDGEVKMWYNPKVMEAYAGIRNAEGGHLKLTANYTNGRLNGFKTHRHYNGRKKIEYYYDNGELVEAKVGHRPIRLSESEAKQYAHEDDLSDIRHYARFINMVNELLVCPN